MTNDLDDTTKITRKLWENILLFESQEKLLSKK